MIEAPTHPADPRTEWLTNRRTGLGGSDVAGVLGVSPWQSPWSVWADKVGLLPIDDDTNERQEFGLLAEPMLRDYFHRRTGLHVIGEQTSVHHPEHPWARVTLDGLVVESPHSTPDDTLGVFESKTTSEAPWAEVPLHYQCQAQWAMWITGTDRCWFGVLHIAYGRPTFRVYEFQRDDTDIDTLHDRCRRFWFDHVTSGIPPATDGHDATLDALAQVYATTIDGAVEADDDLAEHIDGFVYCRDEIKAFEEQQKTHRAAIAAALGEHTVVTRGADDKGRPVVLATFFEQSRTTFDTAAFAARYPRHARRFSKTTTFRVLRPKTKKESR